MCKNSFNDCKLQFAECNLKENWSLPYVRFVRCKYKWK